MSLDMTNTFLFYGFSPGLYLPLSPPISGAPSPSTSFPSPDPPALIRLPTSSKSPIVANSSPAAFENSALRITIDPEPRKKRHRPLVDTTSPVNGLRIKEDTELSAESVAACRVVTGDIDAACNEVEATPTARAELAQIPNLIGDYVCRLCDEKFEDAFLLAQHRCPRIVHVEYRCPQCSKTFNCPANLASHQRWHRPRGEAKPIPSAPSPSFFSSFSVEALLGKSVAGQYSCQQCWRRFRRQANLRKHVCSAKGKSELGNIVTQ